MSSVEVVTQAMRATLHESIVLFLKASLGQSVDGLRAALSVVKCQTETMMAGNLGSPFKACGVASDGYLQGTWPLCAQHDDMKRCSFSWRLAQLPLREGLRAIRRVKFVVMSLSCIRPHVSDGRACASEALWHLPHVLPN